MTPEQSAEYHQLAVKRYFQAEVRREPKRDLRTAWEHADLATKLRFQRDAKKELGL